MKNFIAIGVFITLFISCNKEEINTEENYFIKTKSIDIIEIKKISNSLNKTVLIKDFGAHNKEMQNGEVQLQMLINPLVENGKAIHKEIIQKLISSPNWIMLTANEKEIITNFSDVQFAELSIVFSKFQENITLKEDDTWSAVRSCLSGALGAGDLYYLLIENPRSLITARGSLSLLKHIGGRYLGYIGLGLAIIDFADCISR